MDKPILSYWTISALGLFWNIMGCLNYISQTASVSLAHLPEEYQTVISARPVWAMAAFAISVFAGAVGCILLLLRRRVGVQLLGLSLVGSLLSLACMLIALGFSGSVLLSTGVSVVMSCILMAVALAARTRGWLR